MTLRNGRPVALRPIRPADRDELAAGFDKLSAASRRLRFLGAVSTLSDAHLRYLTEVDGHDHVAWVALDLADPGSTGFGVGRFVRLDQFPDVAEFSLTVLDTVQGHGVGQLLLAMLAVVAPGIGVHTLRGVVSQENDRMADWLQRLGATSKPYDHDLVFDLDLPVSPSGGLSAAEFVETVEDLRRALSESDLG